MPNDLLLLGAILAWIVLIAIACVMGIPSLLDALIDAFKEEER